MQILLLSMSIRIIKMLCVRVPQAVSRAKPFTVIVNSFRVAPRRFWSSKRAEALGSCQHVVPIVVNQREPCPYKPTGARAIFSLTLVSFPSLVPHNQYPLPPSAFLFKQKEHSKGLQQTKSQEQSRLQQRKTQCHRQQQQE